MANVKVAEIPPHETLYDHLDAAGYLMCTFDQFPTSPFEERAIKETEGRRTYINARGAPLTVRTDGERRISAS